MQSNKNNISKETILNIALDLIDENGGIKNVTLRDIAKKAGCAHTNLYNYFSSLDDIFWESLGKVLTIMMDYAVHNLDSNVHSEDNIYLMMSNIIDFSIEHPGWYRLIWLEPLGGIPSDETIKLLHMPGKQFCSEVIKANNDKLSKQKADLICDILHNYMHGEICKFINNRNFIQDTSEIKIKMNSHLKYLYKLLIKEELKV